AEGFVARVGRWCFRRRWWVLAIWLVASTGGALAAIPVFHGLSSGGGPSSLESVQANQVLGNASQKGATVTAVVDGIDPTATTVHDAVLAAAGDVRRISGVATVSTPYDPGLPPGRA